MVNSLISSSLDKVTTGMYNLQSFIANVAPVGELSLTTGGPASTCPSSKLVITQFLFHFSSKDTSQLINGIFIALQKLPKYFIYIITINTCIYIISISNYFIFILKCI